jgi:hypothetical protein
LYRGGSALAYVGGAKTEVDAQHAAYGAQQEKKDATHNPNAMQQFPIGIYALRGWKQRDAYLRAPTKSDYCGDKKRNASSPEDAHCCNGIHAVNCNCGMAIVLL